MKTMRHLYLLLCFFLAAQLGAQVNHGENRQMLRFDPSQDPIALQQDASLHLLVSEFVLAKSLKARLGADVQVLKTYKYRSENGSNHLVFEGLYPGGDPFSISIPLLPDAQERYYFPASQALICSSPGCNNCSIQNGNCVGCCSAVNENSILPQPLLRVQISVDD